MISLNVSAVEPLLNEMVALGERDARLVARRTLVRAMGMANTRAVRALAAETGLVQARIRRSVKLERPTLTNLVAALVVTGRPIPRLAFGARQTRKGVTFRSAGGRRELLTSAFLAKMPTGHRGVFLRKGKKRLGIKEQFGEALPITTVRAAIFKAESQTVAADLRRILEHEIKFRRTQLAESAA